MASAREKRVLPALPFNTQMHASHKRIRDVRGGAVAAMASGPETHLHSEQ